MNKNRDMFYSVFYNNNIPFGIPDGQMIQNNFMPPMNLDNKINELESRINNLEQKISKLDNSYSINYNNEPDNDMYMM